MAEQEIRIHITNSDDKLKQIYPKYKTQIKQIVVDHFAHIDTDNFIEQNRLDTCLRTVDGLSFFGTEMEFIMVKNVFPIDVQRPPFKLEKIPKSMIPYNVI